MNEEALKDMYGLAQSEGYTKSIEDFQSLLSYSGEALNDMYGLAQREGYSKPIEDFEVLLGVKKKGSTPSEPSGGSADSHGFKDEEYEDSPWVRAAASFVGLPIPQLKQRKDQRYDFGDTKGDVASLRSNILDDTKDLVKSTYANVEEETSYLRILDASEKLKSLPDGMFNGDRQPTPKELFDAGIDLDGFPAPMLETLYQHRMGKDVNLEEEAKAYVVSKLVPQALKERKDEYTNSLPENLRNDPEFLEVLTDKIYFEEGIDLDLDGDGRYNDQPVGEFVVNKLNSGVKSIANALEYSATYIAKNVPLGTQTHMSPDTLTDIELKAKRHELKEESEELRNVTTQYTKGISASAMDGDWSNAGMQLLGGLAETAPLIAVTMASAGAGAAGIGIAMNGVTGGVSSYIDVRDQEGYTEASAWGYGLINGLGDAAFSAVGNGIMKSGGKAFAAGSKKTMTDIASGYAKRLGVGMGSEGATEFAVEFTSQYYNSRVTGDGKDISEIARDSFDAFIIGGFAGAGFSLAGSSNTNRTKAASNARFDSETSTNVPEIKNQIRLLVEDAKAESDPKQKEVIFQEIARLNDEVEATTRTRIPFYEMLSVRHPEALDALQKMDADIERIVAQLHTTDNPNLRKVLEGQLERRGKERVELESKYKDEAVKLSPEEKTEIERVKTQDALVESKAELEDARFALENLPEDASTESTTIAQERVDSAKEVHNSNLKAVGEQGIAPPIKVEPGLDSSDSIPGKIRKTAGKEAKRLIGMSDVSQKIRSNPENYIDTQNLKEIKGDLSEMSDAELVGIVSDSTLDLMKSDSDDNISVLAGAEILNRAVADGRTNDIPIIVEALAKAGTTAGRILRQFKELKNSTPIGMSSVIRAEVDRKGNRLSQQADTELDKLTSEYFMRQAEHERIRQELVDGEVTPEKEKAYKDSVVKLKKSERELDKFTNKYIERGWGELAGQIVQGNLLTPASQVVNVGANIVNTLSSVLVDTIGLPIEKIAQALGKQPMVKRNYSINAYLEGLKGMGRGFVEAIGEVKTGQSKGDTEWRMSRGFLPVHALMTAFTKGDLPINKKTGKKSGSQRAKLILQGFPLAGGAAEVMFRLLSIGDTPFRRYGEVKELYRIGRGKGLNGEDLKNFIKYPDKRSAELAGKEGRKLTFQEDTSMSRTATSVLTSVEKGLARAFTDSLGNKIVDPEQVMSFLFKLIAPYRKTPANILHETLTYASPYYATARIASGIRKGDTRAVAENFGKLVVGTIATELALELVKEGLISSVVDFGDDEEKNVRHSEFPPSSINLTGVKRYMDGGDPSIQEGDVFFDYNRLGIFGSVMGATVKGADPEAVKNRAKEDSSIGTRALEDMFGVKPFGSMSHMMDQSFLQGINSSMNLFASLTSPDELERSFEKFVGSTFKAAASVPLPNSLSVFNRTQQEYMPDMRVTKDMNLSERLIERAKYTIMDKTFNTGGIPVRYDWKGEPIKRTPKGADPFVYHIFDITKARQGEGDPVASEIYRLYEESLQFSEAIGTPNYVKSTAVSVPNINGKKMGRAISRIEMESGKEYTFLDDAEFTSGSVRFNTEQINRLIEITGKARYQAIQELMADSKYKDATDYEKLGLLGDLAKNHDKALQLIPIRKGVRSSELYPHSIAVLDMMQEVYENQSKKEGE